MILVDESARKPSITAISYGPNEVEVVESATVAQAKALLGKRETLWVNIEGLGGAELIRELGTAFSLHSLALEDCLNHHQRVKTDNYGDHLFIVARVISSTTELETTQLSVFLGEQLVITLHESPLEVLRLLRPRLDDPHSFLRNNGGDFLAYAILDAVLDQ
jgi:magnesium transporter